MKKVMNNTMNRMKLTGRIFVSGAKDFMTDPSLMGIATITGAKKGVEKGSVKDGVVGVAVMIGVAGVIGGTATVAMNWKLIYDNVDEGRVINW